MTGPSTFPGFAPHGYTPGTPQQRYDRTYNALAADAQRQADFYRNRAAKLVRDAGNTLVPLVDDRAECGVKGGVR